jgi:hypothetical protein
MPEKRRNEKRKRHPQDMSKYQRINDSERYRKISTDPKDLEF